MRRTLARLLLLPLGLALVGPDPAVSRPRGGGSGVAAITVDVSRLRALGLGPVADIVQGAVARELAGGISGPIGGRVLVRITGLSLNSYAGSDGGGGGGGGGGAGGGSASNVDYLEGDLLVLGPRGEVLSQRHQLSTTPASSGGPYYLPGAEQRRVEMLSRNFADWLKRS